MIVGDIPAAAQSAALWRLCGDTTPACSDFLVSSHLKKLQHPRQDAYSRATTHPSPDSSFTSLHGEPVAFQDTIFNVPSSRCCLLRLGASREDGMTDQSLASKGTTGPRLPLADVSIPVHAATRLLVALVVRRGCLSSKPIHMD